MPPKTNAKASGKAVSRKKGDNAEVQLDRSLFRLPSVDTHILLTLWAFAQVPASKRAKRVNSRKRFREEEGYDEAEVVLRCISSPPALSS